MAEITPKEQALIDAARKYKAAHAAEIAVFDNWRRVRSKSQAYAGEKAAAYEATTQASYVATDVFNDLMRAVDALE